MTIIIKSNQLMGIRLSNLFYRTQPPKQPQVDVKEKASHHEVDILKSKLKIVRDKIEVFVEKKRTEVEEVSEEIKTKYTKNRNKKDILALLTTKKELLTIIENGQERLRVIKKTIRQVQTQHLNSQLINVLEDSNKYMKKVQIQLEEKDWKNIVEEAKQKYQGIEWDKQDQQQDEQFQTLWKELGGDKLDKKFKQSEEFQIINKIQELPLPVVKVVEIKQVQQEAHIRQILVV